MQHTRQALLKLVVYDCADNVAVEVGVSGGSIFTAIEGYRSIMSRCPRGHAGKFRRSPTVRTVRSCTPGFTVTGMLSAMRLRSLDRPRHKRTSIMSSGTYVVIFCATGYTNLLTGFRHRRSRRFLQFFTVRFGRSILQTLGRTRGKCPVIQPGCRRTAVLQQAFPGMALENLCVPDVAPQRVHALVPRLIGHLEDRGAARGSAGQEA